MVTIVKGDTVEVVGDRNAGLVGKVLQVYPLPVPYDRRIEEEPRAFVEFQLSDGPYRRNYDLKYLKKVVTK